MGFSRQEYWSGVPLPSPKIRDTKGIFHAKIGTIKKKIWKEIMEKAMATHSSTHAWKIPWTEEPSGL